MNPNPVWQLGPDAAALAFLHDMLTQDVIGMSEGEVRVAALLTEKGRIRAVVRVMVAGGVLLETDPVAEDAIESGLVRIAGLAGVEAARSSRSLPELAEADRIRAGIPKTGFDVDESVLINETPLVRSAVSFSKGCYPGQESVARVHNLGSVKRMLCVLSVDGPPPAPGAVVTAGGAHAGVATSSAADDKGTVAFAMLDAASMKAGELRVEASPATIVLP